MLSVIAINAEKLAPCVNTHLSKIFDNSVVSNAAKTKQYSGPESVDFHLKVAAC